MVRKLRKATGAYNTLNLVIPKALTELLGLVPNQEVDITLRGGKIIVAPIKETNEN